MSQITTEMVKDLRVQTGVSIMQCRKALEEAEGNTEKALAILKKNSADVAEKKSARETKDGRVAVREDAGRAVLLAIHCETDFVARNQDFVTLLDTLLVRAWDDGIEKMKEGAKELIDLAIQKTGENIELGEVYEVKGSILASYVHNAKSAVIVSLFGGDSVLAHDIAMQVTAMKPEYISKEDISGSSYAMIREIFEKEIEGENKPAEIKQKILDGKMSTYFKEKTLLDQPFIKDPSKTIGGLLAEHQAKIVELKRYSI